jgi:hypothetical protein
MSKYRVLGRLTFTILISCTSLVAFVHASGLNESKPITARMRQTWETIVDGKIVETRTNEGIFYRNSRGSTLERWNDNAQPARLFISGHGGYLVYYESRMAFGSVFEEGGSWLFNPNRPYNFLGQDSVESISCIYSEIPLGPHVEHAGKACWSSDYKVELKNDWTVPSARGLTPQVFELYDIKLNVEPDPNLFDLTGFFVLRTRFCRSSVGCDDYPF